MINNPKTVTDYKIKYNLTGDNLDDLLIELFTHSILHKWPTETYDKKEKHLQRLYSEIFIQLNEWLVSFNLPKQNTINKCKKILENEVFASIIDVKEETYYNLRSKGKLQKYIRNNPEKRVSKKLAKDEGYRVFLENIF